MANITEIDYAGYVEATTNPNSAFNRSLDAINANQAEWITFEETSVLRVKDSRFIAAPVTGRKNAAKFMVIDINDRSEVYCFLNKTEVRGWLTRMHISN